MKQINLFLNDLYPYISNQLKNNKSVLFFPMGTSMLPTIRPSIDSVLLSPKNKKIKLYDLPLYINDDGKFILHRIIEIKDDYICLGDNQYFGQEHVNYDQIVGIVTGIYKNNRFYSTDNFLYKIFSIIWVRTRKSRYFIFKLKSKLRRHFFK